MRFHQAFRDIESQTSAFRVAGVPDTVEAVEDVRLIVGADAAFRKIESIAKLRQLVTNLAPFGPDHS